MMFQNRNHEDVISNLKGREEELLKEINELKEIIKKINNQNLSLEKANETLQKCIEKEKERKDSKSRKTPKAKNVNRSKSKCKKKGIKVKVTSPKKSWELSIRNFFIWKDSKHWKTSRNQKSLKGTTISVQKLAKNANPSDLLPECSIIRGKLQKLELSRKSVRKILSKKGKHLKSRRTSILKSSRKI